MARQITFFRYEVGMEELQAAPDGRYDLVRTPICEVEDSSMTKTDIRKAIEATGATCKRGTNVYAKKLGKVVYRFTTEDLKGIAQSREELPLD